METFKNYKIELESVQAAKDKYLPEIANLRKQWDELALIKDTLTEEISQSRSKNEFLNMEQQCLQASVDQMEIDWPHHLEACAKQIKETRSKLRNENSGLSAEKLRLQHQVDELKMNSEARYNVIYWKKQQTELLDHFYQFHDLCSGREREAMELKRRVLILEDSRVEHAIEKRLWLPRRQRMHDAVRDGDDVLFKRIRFLKAAVKEVESENEKTRSQVGAFARCFDELKREVSSGQRDPEECASRLRAILDKYKV